MITWHFKRFWWAYVLVVILVAMPWIIVRAQVLPPLDLKTARVIYQRYDEAIVARYGQPINKEYDKARAPLEEVFSFGDPRLVRLTRYEPLGGMPSLAEDARQAQAAYGPLLAPFERLDRAGIYYRTYDEMENEVAASKNIEDLSKLRFTPVPNFLLIQTRTKYHRALAGQAVSRRDWEGALVQLQLAAHTADPVRINFLIGHLIAVACRAIAYGGYADLLAADAPEAVLRQALTDLTELRRTDPTANAWVTASETRNILDSLIVGSLGQKRFSAKMTDAQTAAFQYMNLGEIILHIARLKDKIEDKKQRAVVDHLLREYPEIIGQGSEYGLAEFMIKSLSRKPSLTVIPMVRRLALDLIKNQPELFSSEILPMETLKTLDPWTVAMFAPNIPLGGINNREVASRSSIALTRGRLMELAFAARLFEREHGRWPERLDELIPAYLPELEKGYADDEGKAIITPLHMGWVGTNEDLRGLSMSRIVPLRMLDEMGAYFSLDPESKELVILGDAMRLPETALIDLDSTYTITLNDTMGSGKQVVAKVDPVRGAMYGNEWPYFDDPVLPLAIAESLRAHPRLASDVEVRLPSVSLKGRKPGIPESEPLTMTNADFDIEYSPLSADYARLVTDQSDALYWAHVAKVLPPDKRGENKPDLKERTVAPPVQVEVRARITFPERLFAIWSPGPDGKDDGGQIAYDPSNGSLSRGDILAFPERF